MAMLMKLVCFGLVVAMVALAPQQAEGLTCGQVAGSLLPCLSYVRGGSLTSRCCDAIKGLAGAATSTIARRLICSCLKQIAAQYPETGTGAAKVVEACGFTSPYSLSPDTKCSSINMSLKHAEE